jgi:outer membrane receptor protein involved in Fe transport
MKAIFVLAIILCVSITAIAQTEIGAASLSGKITDSSGAVVPAASVTVTEQSTGFSRTTMSNEAGLYNLPRLPIGLYNLSVSKEGFKAIKRDAVPLQVGAVAAVDFRLEIGNAAEEVTVTAEATAVETTSSTASSNITQEAVANLPVNGRNFLDFTLLTPGVVRDPTRGGDLSFAGQRGPANTVLVDGADSNNLFFGQATGRVGFRPFSYSEEAVQEFQVSSAGYQAEVGRAGGGAINVITKSGSNSVHGSIFEFYRDKGMNANTFINNARGFRKSPYHFNQFGGTLGGPIRKDKLFFFFSYDAQRNKGSFVVVPSSSAPAAALAALSTYLQPYQTTQNVNAYLGKVDWDVSPKDRVTFRYNVSRYLGKNQENAFGASAAEHTGNNEINTDNVNGAYTRILGSNMVWESRFNFVRDNEPGFANASTPEAVITGIVTIGRNNFSPRYTTTKTYQPISNLSLVTGSHSMKVGGDFNFERIDNYFPGFFSGGYVFPNYDAFVNKTPTSYTQGFSGTSTVAPVSHPNVNEYALFAQDSWRVNDRLSVNVGLRYDLFNYVKPTTANPNPGLAAAGLSTTNMPTDKSNFGPRIGFAYTPFAGNRTAVRASYGIFYSRTPGILLSTAMLQNGIDVLTYQLSSSTSTLPTYPDILSAPPSTGLAPPSIYIVDKDFRQGASQQYTLQVEHALGAGYSVTVGYLGLHATHLPRSRDINLYPSELTTGSLTNGTAIQFWRHPGPNGSPLRPNPAFGRITLFESGASSVYNGLSLKLDKRFSRGFQLLGSYTFSKVIDTAPDGTSVVPGNSGDDAKVAQDTLLPNVDRGPGVADIRNRFVFSAVWDLNYARSLSNSFARAALGSWNLSTIIQMQSERHFSVTNLGDPGNDGNTNNDREPFVGRGTLEGPGLATVDLRLTRDIPIVERARIRLIVEAFNLFNRANFSSISQNRYSYNAATRVFTPNAIFKSATGVLDPGIGSRALQLAAKITF